jgi:multidrug efflux pump subunit AcrB
LRTAADLDVQTAHARLGQVWEAVLASIDRKSLSSMSMMQPGSDKAAILDIEASTSRAAEGAFRSVRSRLQSFDGARATVRLRPSAFVESVAGDARRTELIASAATDAEAESLAQRLIEAMSRRGFRRVDDDRRTVRRLALVLQWDESRLAANGADRRAIERDVRAALGDLDAGQVDITAAEPSIRLLPTTTSDLTLAPVRLGQSVVPLGAIAGQRLATRLPAVFRDERRPARRLLFEGGSDEAVDAAIADVTSVRAGPHTTERVRIAGHARELRDAFGQMRLALLLAAVLLYLTVAAFYESLLLPLPVIAALPFAGAGAFAALAITGQSLNLMSFLGLIFLGGVVVNHTVVLLDRAEQLRNAGVPEEEAVRRAAADRYRPVIMTTLTAILGMLPLALFGGPGVELRRSIAVTVIGGLATATVGTLLLIPLLHRAIEPLRRRSPIRQQRRGPEIAHA